MQSIGIDCAITCFAAYRSVCSRSKRVRRLKENYRWIINLLNTEAVYVLRYTKCIWIYDLLWLARSKGSLIIFYRAASTSGPTESKISNAVLLKQSQGISISPRRFTSVSEIRNTIGPRAKVKGREKRVGEKRRRIKKIEERRPCRKSLMFMHGLRNEPSRRIMHL